MTNTHCLTLLCEDLRRNADVAALAAAKVEDADPVALARLLLRAHKLNAAAGELAEQLLALTPEPPEPPTTPSRPAALASCRRMPVTDITSPGATGATGRAV